MYNNLGSDKPIIGHEQVRDYSWLYSSSRLYSILWTIPDYTQVRDYIQYYGWISFANFQILKFQRYKLTLNYFNFCLNSISVIRDFLTAVPVPQTFIFLFLLFLCVFCFLFLLLFCIYKFYFFLIFYSLIGFFFFVKLFFLLKLFYCISLSLFHFFSFLFYIFLWFYFLFVYVCFMF